MSMRPWESLHNAAERARNAQAHLDSTEAVKKPPAQPRDGGGPYAIGAPKDQWPGLSKLVEELGELSAELGKLLGTGGDPNHWTGDLIPRIEDEMGDVLAAIAYFSDVNSHRLDLWRLMARDGAKQELFWGWHTSARS